MSDLPEPVFIETDPAVIEAEQVSEYEALTGKTLYPAQPDRVLISLSAYRESLVRIAIQEAAKQCLVRYATYPILDYLGEDAGCVRIPAQYALATIRFTLTAIQAVDVVIPSGTRVESKDGAVIFATDDALTIAAGLTTGDAPATCQTAGTAGNGYLAAEINNLLDPVEYVTTAANTTTTNSGAETEEDDPYRERIFLAPESYSCAGPEGEYIYHAKSAHQDIIDVGVTSPDPGCIAIYPLTKTGEPSQEMLALVLAACNPDDVRPMTDNVTAVAPTEVEFTIEGDVTLYATADQDIVEEQIAAALETYSAAQKAKLGADIVVNQIEGIIMSISGVYSVTLTEPDEDVVLDITEWSNCTDIDITVTGTVEG